MPLESIVLDIDPRSIPAAIALANQALSGLEGKADSAGKTAQAAIEKQSKLLLQFSDSHAQATKRIVDSVERQNAAYKLSEVDKLVAQRDRYLKQLEGEPDKIARVTKAYDEMIGRAKSGGNAAQAFGQNIQQYIQAPVSSAGNALTGMLTTMGPWGIGLAAGGAAMVGFAAATWEAAKGLGEYAVRVRDIEIKTGLSTKQTQEYGLAAKMVGQDVSVVERAMRGLTMAIEGNDAAAEKARGILRNWGVDIAGVRDGTVSTDTVLRQVSEGLNAAGTNWERNAQLIAVFKRAGIELAPFLLELKENMKGASEVKFASDAELQKWLEYQKEIAKTKEAWNQLTLQIEAATVATTGFLAKHLAEPIQKGKSMELNALALEASAWAFSGKVRSQMWAEEHPLETGAAAEIMAPDIGREHIGLTGEHGGMASPLRPTATMLGAFAQSQQETEKRHAKEAAKAAKEALEAEAQAIREDTAMWERNAKARGEALWADLKLTQQIHNRGKEFAAGPGVDFEHFRPSLPSAPSGDLAEDMARRMKTSGALEKISAGAQQDALRRSAALGIRGAEDPQAVYNIRIKLATDLANLEMSRWSTQMTADEKAIASAQLLRDLAKEQAAAQDELDEKRAEADKRHADEIRRTSSDLLHGLLTNPRGFRTQLSGTLKEAAIGPLAESFGGAMASLFGGHQDPMKTATDQNTAVTAQNAMAVATLTAMLAGGMGVQAPAITATGGAPGISVPPVSVPGASAGGPGAGGFGMAAALTSLGLGAFARTSRYTPRTMFPAGGGPPSMSIERQYHTDAGMMIGSDAAGLLSLGMAGGGGVAGGGGTGGAGGFTGFAGAPPWIAGGGVPRQTAAPGAGVGGVIPGLLGGRPGAGFNPAALLKNFKTTDWGGFTRTGGTPVYGTDAEGSDVQTGTEGGGITGVSGVAGQALTAGGMMLATQGLLGSSRGTWGGVAEGTVGGAAIGFQMGGPLGAAIGGAVGLGIGLGEKLAGVESPEREAVRLVKSIYGVSIDINLGKQIAGIAQQKYAGHVGMAVRDPEVRKMVMLYSEATGQKMPLSATTPQSASLAESGGRLYQQANWQNGTPYTYASNLPVEGGYQTANYPGVSIAHLQVTVGDKGAAGYFNGQVMTPDAVQARFADAMNGSNGRLDQTAMILQPGLDV